MQSSSDRNFKFLTSALLDIYPDHRRFLDSSFADRTPDEISFSYSLADLLMTLMGDKLDSHLKNYRTMCSEFWREALYFARHGNYRRTNIEEVIREVYSNPAYMKMYIEGLLVSQLYFNNHFRVLSVFANQFLKGYEAKSVLEIGPGHGLFLLHAAVAFSDCKCFGLDISETSLQTTRGVFERMKLADRLELEIRDVAKSTGPQRTFDVLILSEILEHLENPGEILDNLSQFVDRQSRIFINVPVNSPAPDHIFLWQSPEALEDFLQGHALEIVAKWHCPMTGYTLSRARKARTTISCVYEVHLNS